MIIMRSKLSHRCMTHRQKSIESMSKGNKAKQTFGDKTGPGVICRPLTPCAAFQRWIRGPSQVLGHSPFHFLPCPYEQILPSCCVRSVVISGYILQSSSQQRPHLGSWEPSCFVLIWACCRPYLDAGCCASLHAIPEDRLSKLECWHMPCLSSSLARE